MVCMLTLLPLITYNFHSLHDLHSMQSLNAFVMPSRQRFATKRSIQGNIVRNLIFLALKMSNKVQKNVNFVCFLCRTMKVELFYWFFSLIFAIEILLFTCYKRAKISPPSLCNSTTKKLIWIWERATNANSFHSS